MSKSHGHQQIALFNGLLKRAQKGEAGLSKGAMALAYDFDSSEQLDHALAALVASQHIAIDIDGRFPSIRIFKSKYHCAVPLKRPIFLSSGQSRPRVETPAPPAQVTPTPAVAPAPVEAAPPVVLPTTAQIPTAPRQIAFRIADDDLSWILDELATTDQAISFSALCKQMFQAELDRRRSPAAPRHKISARVLRTAREEGLDLDTFVTSLIEVGLTAREMNRKGL